MRIYIKNMVCARCIAVVCSELEKLGAKNLSVNLGRAEFESPVAIGEKALRESLMNYGFDLIKSKDEKLVEEIKHLVIKMVRDYAKVNGNHKISVYLSEQLGCSYSLISKTFSRVEGFTLEKYIILQKIERVKELLTYHELTLTQIADKTGYSSVQHLSRQFKSITGKTVRQYLSSKLEERKSIDSLNS